MMHKISQSPWRVLSIAQITPELSLLSNKRAKRFLKRVAPQHWTFPNMQSSPSIEPSRPSKLVINLVLVKNVFSVRKIPLLILVLAEVTVQLAFLSY